MEREFYSVKDLSVIFGVTQQAITMWVSRKKMPYPDIREKRFTRWKKETIQPFIDDPIKWRQQHS